MEESTVAADLAGGRVWNAEAVVVWARFRDRSLAAPVAISAAATRTAVHGVTEAAREPLVEPTDSEAQGGQLLALVFDDVGIDGEPLDAVTMRAVACTNAGCAYFLA